MWTISEKSCTTTMCLCLFLFCALRWSDSELRHAVPGIQADVLAVHEGGLEHELRQVRHLGGPGETLLREGLGGDQRLPDAVHLPDVADVDRLLHAAHRSVHEPRADRVHTDP